MEKIIKEIKELLIESDVTTYQIGKDTGLNFNMLQFYRIGQRKVENMSLKTASILYDYIKKLNKENK